MQKGSILLMAIYKLEYMYIYATIKYPNKWHSLLPKERDDGDGEANDGESGTNVGHPSESSGIWVSSRWGVWTDVLQEGE